MATATVDRKTQRTIIGKFRDVAGKTAPTGEKWNFESTRFRKNRENPVERNLHVLKLGETPMVTIDTALDQIDWDRVAENILRASN